MAHKRHNPIPGIAVCALLFVAGLACGYCFGRYGTQGDTKGTVGYENANRVLEERLDHAGNAIEGAHVTVGDARNEVAGYRTEVGELGSTADTIHTGLGEDSARLGNLEEGISLIESILSQAESRNKDMENNRAY